MLQGHFEAIDFYERQGWFAKGWATDAEALDRPVLLALVWENGILVRFHADQLRADLHDAGLGNGRCAFEVRLPDKLLDGGPHMVHVVAIDHGRALEGGPRMFAMPRLRGRLERVSGLELEGWAKDELDPERPAVLDILVDGRCTGQVVCSRYRSDLPRSLGTSGHNAFRFTLPITLCDGQPHEVALRFANTDTALEGSPHLVTLSPNVLTPAITELEAKLRELEQQLAAARAVLERMPLCALADPAAYDRWLAVEEARWYDPEVPAVLSDNSSPLISVIAAGDHDAQSMVALSGLMRASATSWELLIAGRSENDSRPIASEETAVGSLEAALRRARGDFILMLPPGYVPHSALLRELQAAVAADGMDLVYTDEDTLCSDGRRRDPHFKPDWDPERFLCTEYVGPVCVRRSHLLEIYEGLSRDSVTWEALVEAALLRLTPERVRHIPHVLLHKKEDARACEAAEVRAVRLQRLLDDLGGGITVSPQPDHMLRIGWPLPNPAPAVTLIIPTRDRVDLLRTCITSILNRTNYPAYSIVVVDNGSTQPETLDYFVELSGHPAIRILHRPGPFNYSALNNEAVALTDTPLIGLINNDIEVIESDWLSEMVSHAIRPAVGVVGAKLLYPNGRIQHGGVVIGFHGVADNVQQAFGRNDPGYFSSAIATQNVTAVTAACLLCRRDVYEAVGGLDEKAFPISFNDVDFCLKVRDTGLRVIWTPHALLYHHESASRGADRSPEAFRREEREAANLREKWRTESFVDPFYSPNLARTGYSHCDFAWPKDEGSR